MSKNQCSGCSRNFTGISAFEDHRAGSYTRNTRHCLSEDEMSARGLERKASGRWGYRSDTRLLARLARLRQERAA